MDSWAGYDVPRERLLRLFEGHGNIVVLTGDEHINWVGELRRDNGRGEAVAVEMVATSISSEGDGSDMNPMLADILAENDCLKFANSQRGYVLCDVTPERWESRLRVMDKVSVRDRPIVTRATITVPHGRPEVVIS